MRQLTICAAIALVASLASVPAKAEYHYGPNQVNGQCWNKAFGNGNSAYGYWSACPQAASTTAATVRHHRRHVAR